MSTGAFFSYSIMQNGGQFCDFGHFHLHLFPRYPNDEFGWTIQKDRLNIHRKLQRELEKN